MEWVPVSWEGYLLILRDILFWLRIGRLFLSFLLVLGLLLLPFLELGHVELVVGETGWVNIPIYPAAHLHLSLLLRFLLLMVDL